MLKDLVTGIWGVRIADFGLATMDSVPGLTYKDHVMV